MPTLVATGGLLPKLRKTSVMPEELVTAMAPLHVASISQPVQFLKKHSDLIGKAS